MILLRNEGQFEKKNIVKSRGRVTVKSNGNDCFL